MKRITVIALTLTASTFLVMLGQMDEVDSTMATQEYCTRVAMYELDVSVGVEDIRGHRNFRNLECPSN